MDHKSYYVHRKFVDCNIFGELRLVSLARHLNGVILTLTFALAYHSSVAFVEVLRFVHTQEMSCDVPTVVVQYAFQYTDMGNCPPSSKNDPLDPISVTIPANGAALRVIEASVDVSRDYRFTATYFGSTLGFFIDSINGTSSSNPCFWFFYVQTPESPNPVLSNLGVSNYNIPESGYVIFMRFEKSNEVDAASAFALQSKMYLLGLLVMLLMV